MKYTCLIIGGGLSGLAAGIRIARFTPNVCILEKHNRIGGLNSYYQRHGILIETGLHAFTNYASPSEKMAPLNLLFRQLKLSRKSFITYPQEKSLISFENQESLCFTNNFEDFVHDIEKKFIKDIRGFERLIQKIRLLDPMGNIPSSSARSFLETFIQTPLLREMILCPLLYYGSSREQDMDLRQFLIMFRSIYMEGMFRPEKTMREFLATLTDHYASLGGNLRVSSPVRRILHRQKKVHAVELENGEIIECEHLLSTVGYDETQFLLGNDEQPVPERRMGFVENIFLLPPEAKTDFNKAPTILFYNSARNFSYQRPNTPVDFSSGAICFPSHYSGRTRQDFFEIRSTHLANYHLWKSLANKQEDYQKAKEQSAAQAKNCIEQHFGCSINTVLYQDTFTPITIERYCNKREGAIYGKPQKFIDGDLGYHNLFLAGTDQGYLGIVGSMLSGVSMANRHVLVKL